MPNCDLYKHMTMDFIFKDLINSKSSLAFHGHLIEDTKLLVSHFSCINFPHVRHQENVVVHHLSRRAILLPILLIWMEDIYIYHHMHTDILLTIGVMRVD